jgi:hypothetical protein
MGRLVFQKINNVFDLLENYQRGSDQQTNLKRLHRPSLPDGLISPQGPEKELQRQPRVQAGPACLPFAEEEMGPKIKPSKTEIRPSWDGNLKRKSVY